MVKGGGELRGFEFGTGNKKFVWADARIEGDQVFLSGGDVRVVRYLRYAWADNPEGANLYNKEGLPASPFTTEKDQ
jgi:sialate O-acetylesterase